MGDASNIESLKFNLSDFNEDMLHTILELVSDGIWDWNANTGFVYRNPAGTRCSATRRTPSITPC